MLYYKDLGRMEYIAALEIQEQLVQAKQRQSHADVLLFVEHPHVYTLGRGGSDSTCLRRRKFRYPHRTRRRCDLSRTGQLVVYPILDLRSKLRQDVHRFVRNLEQSALQTLNDFGLTGTRRPPFTGIWLGDKKIAAIGVAVRRCITFHGLALNVNTDLEFFKRIVPCGLPWADVTSMAHELGRSKGLVTVNQRFLHDFAELFGYHDVKKILGGRRLLYQLDEQYSGWHDWNV